VTERVCERHSKSRADGNAREKTTKPDGRGSERVREGGTEADSLVCG
jgi:hypothetical protein